MEERKEKTNKQTNKNQETKREGEIFGEKTHKKGRKNIFWGVQKVEETKGKRMEGWTKSPREGISRNMKRKKKDN